MDKNTFAFGATVEASVNVPRLHFRALLRAAKWPGIAAIPGISIYVAFFYQTAMSTTQGQILTGEAAMSPTALILMSWVSMLPMLLIAVAFAYNWQRFVMHGDDARLSRESGIPYNPPEWWDGYKASLVKFTLMFLAFMVPYAILFWDVFASMPMGQSRTIPAEEAGGLLARMGGWFVFAIIAAPYFMRASLVFPAISAGIPDATFKNALAVSRGMGWKLVGTYFVAAFALMVILLLGMIALMIVGGIFGGIASLISPSAFAVIFVPVGFVLYVAIYLYMAAFYAGFPALVLIQILPDFHSRWDTLSGKGPDKSAPPPSEEFKLSTYGKKKGED